MTPYGKIGLGQYWLRLRNGLLPNGTEPLPKPLLTYHQWGLVIFTWEQLDKKKISKQWYEFQTNSRLQLDLSGRPS